MCIQPVVGEVKSGAPNARQLKSGELGVDSVVQCRPPSEVTYRPISGVKPNWPVSWIVSHPWLASKKSTKGAHRPASLTSAGSWPGVGVPSCHEAPPSAVLKTTNWSAQAVADPTASATKACVASRKNSL